LRQLVEEAKLDDAALALVERVQAGGDQRAVLDLLEAGVFDAQLLGERVVSPVLERRMQGSSGIRVRGVERVDHLFLLRPGRLGKLGNRGRASELVRELVEDAREADAQLLQAPRDVHRPGLVPEVAPNLADDRRHRVARELDAAIDIEPVDGLDQSEGADLHQILEWLAATRIAIGERSDEWHELEERLIAGSPITFPVIRAEKRIDVPLH